MTLAESKGLRRTIRLREFFDPSGFRQERDSHDGHVHLLGLRLQCGPRWIDSRIGVRSASGRESSKLHTDGSEVTVIIWSGNYFYRSYPLQYRHSTLLE